MSKCGRLLIVDDEADLRDALAFSFRRKGFEVICSESGNAAFQVIMSQPVDAIVSDIRMPDGDGIELLDRVKKDFSEMPVLLISGYADITVEEVYERGAAAILSKPFNMSALLETVKRKLVPLGAWKQEDASEADAALKIEMSLPDLDQAMLEKKFSLGRGGMFVQLPSAPQCRDRRVHFDLRLGDNSRLITLKGTGIVRWCRRKPEGDREPGIGVEFLELEEACRERVMELIQSLQSRAYIPRN